MLTTLWIPILVAVGLCGAATLLIRRKQYPPLPPGPRRIPIIGNLRNLPSPSQKDWLHWLKLKEQYGPISSLSVLGTHIIVLNDARLAVQLLEKRSAIHSLRPQQNFTDMSGWHNVLGARRNPEHVRKTRKNLYQEIGSNKSVSAFDEVQNTEVSHFLLRLLSNPEKLQQHIRKEAGGIVLKIAYGYTIEPRDRDPLVDLADKAMEDFSSALLPATWAVDFIPLLKFLPEWFPGASFIKIAKKYDRRQQAFSDVPYEFVKQQMKRTGFFPSFLSNLLQSNPVEHGTEEENIVKWSAGSLYAGGADTTVSSIASFFLAMALFPEVQRRAQQELDTVVGEKRFPHFHDRENLPYINALVKEVLRWHPVVPMNLAHTSNQDDTCDGYFIPKGSSILANIWAFTHDPDVYHDPMTFKPERFLASSDGHIPERDPHLLVFGFGRRACPGRTLADANVFLTVAQTLAVFNMSKPVVDGKPQDILFDFLPGVISHPAPFDLSIKPRSVEHKELILSLEKTYPWEKSDAELLPPVLVV
ncbi:hypothetical protein N7452_006117 [Penicillium brevicompactum]|uniref:O-methylsterigmatocystin oxidoreductase n=1 Tax=Penicillium brevicompactum TaxID=5074 RepID=A0A9W9QMU1_PENBR|nr:hypothetical protein N7452_006117 [Penicillium brevicompactum]